MTRRRKPRKPRSMGNEKDNRPCRFFKSKEGCKFGDKCWFSHVVENPPSVRIPSSTSRANPPVESTSAAPRANEQKSKTNDKHNGTSGTAEAQTPCRFFLQGQCKKGNLCQWNHGSLEHKKQEDIMEEEAEATIKQIVLGDSTLVTCSAGMQVRHVVCGFDCRFITIKNIPQDTKHSEIEELFAQLGVVDTARYYIVNMRTLNDKVETKVFADASIAEYLTLNLDGTVFKNEILDAAVDGDAGPNKMITSAQNANVLTISWKPSPPTYLVHCYRPWYARKIIGDLHNTVRRGHRIQAELVGSPCICGCDIQVKLSGLPVGESLNMKETHYCMITNTTPFSSVAVERDLRHTIEAIAGYQTYEISPPISNRVDMEVRIRFDSWADAKRVHDRLTRPLRPGYPKFDLHLPVPFEYSVQIPLIQYRSQKSLWDSLSERPDERATKAAAIKVTETAEHALIRVLGEEEKEVGRLKVRIENLVAGETLDASMWHRAFLTGSGQRILKAVSNRSKTYIRSDSKTKSLKLYADNRTKEGALKLVKKWVERLNNSEFSVNIDRGAVGFFTRRGLPALKNDLGDDAARLELTLTPRLVIRGGEEAHRTVDRLLEESQRGPQIYIQSGEYTCPVCFDEPSTPILLGCKHAYCTECIRHFLVSASDRKQFPLVCAGDGDNCKVPIAIPVIQRFLSQQQLDELLETAVTSYIEKRRGQFQYCITPDCKQVYRRGRNVRTCPSCLVNICTRCHKEAHAGMTCDERELQDNLAEQERRNEQWAATSGAKRCPRCRVFVQKIEGCNHMECHCGAHFCWICLQLFDRQAIYGHMQTVHGSIDAPDVPQVNQALQQHNNEQMRADFEYAQRLQQEELVNVGQHLNLDVGQIQQAMHAEEERVQRRREEQQRGGWCIIM